jgi:hypothetical protein
MNISGLLHLLKKNNELVPQSLRTKLSHYIYEYLFPVSDRLGQDDERCLSIRCYYKSKSGQGHEKKLPFCVGHITQVA